MTIHSGDLRLAAPGRISDSPEDPGWHVSSPHGITEFGQQLPQVGTCAESPVAGSGEYGNQELVVIFKSDESGRELEIVFLVQRVHGVGTVDRDHSGGVVYVESDGQS